MAYNPLDIPGITDITDIDLDVALQNSLERGQVNLHESLIALFHSNPRFLLRLLSVAHARSQGLELPATEQSAYEEGVLYGAALLLTAQMQHADAPELPPLTETTSAA